MSLAAIGVLGYRDWRADPMKETAHLRSGLWRLFVNPLRRGELVIVTKAQREWGFLVADLPGWLNAISDAMDARTLEGSTSQP